MAQSLFEVYHDHGGYTQIWANSENEAVDKFYQNHPKNWKIIKIKRLG